ncbi:MAG: hypothetical protein QOH84_1185, partial [Kribbellaceae bacterium]|nr:hypothetical protein [Kribbellaceae bacterium]
MDGMTEADLGELRSTVEKLLAAPGEATSRWVRLASAGVATVLIEAGESGMRVLAGVGEQVGHALSDVPFVTIAGGVAAVVRTAPQSSTRSELLAGLDEGVTAALAVPSSFSVVSARLPLPALESGSLSGTVYDVLADPLTRLFIVPCTDGDEPCVAVVDAGDVQVSEAANLDPTRRLVTIRFDKSQAHLLQRGGAVPRAVADAVRVETVALSAEMIGAAEAALEETVTFVSGRVAFGGLLAEQQAVR